MQDSRGFPGRVFTPRPRQSDGNDECFRMEINSACTGRVIGKGGMKIREIQQQCNVHVYVDKSNMDSGIVVVELKGDSANVDKAKRMVNDVVNMQDNGHQQQQDRNFGGNRRDQYTDRSGGGNFGGNRGRFEDNRSGGGNFGGNRRDRYGDNRSSYRQPEDPLPNPPGQQDLPMIDWNSINAAQEEKQKELLKTLPQLIKHFYQEHPQVTSLTSDEVTEFRKSMNNIMVNRTFAEESGDDDIPIPKPVFKFEHCFEAYPDLMEELHKQKFEKPSPIQCQAWPVLLSGEDLIGIAQTGSGKTLAFLLPGMIHTEFQPVPRGERGGPNVLVLAPTRELALQIRDEVAKYNFRGIKSVCVYGGGSVKEQSSTIEQGVEIIIATPGRLNDLVARGTIDVSTITYLVLDEADRMLDMGFEPQIRKVLLDIRPDRQTIMTSATWPPGVRRLAASYMKNPIQVYVGTLDLAAVHTVSQNIEIVDETEKYERIELFVKNMGPHDKAIIFCGKKARADELASELCMVGYNCQVIHGDREQVDREKAVKDIKTGLVNILVATDVASRGLDIEDITHVINYDFPRNIEEYVHRIGRTGRAGRSGIALSLLTRQDWGSASELIKILEEADQDVPDELRSMADRFVAMKERMAVENATYGGNRRPQGGRRFNRS